DRLAFPVVAEATGLQHEAMTESFAGSLEIGEGVDGEEPRRLDAELSEAGFFEQAILRDAQGFRRRVDLAGAGQSCGRALGYVLELEGHHVALGEARERIRGRVV